MGKYSWIYILRCKNNDYYVGITDRLHNRLKEHTTNNGSIVNRRSPNLDLFSNDQPTMESVHWLVEHLFL